MKSCLFLKATSHNVLPRMPMVQQITEHLSSAALIVSSSLPACSAIRLPPQRNVIVYSHKQPLFFCAWRMACIIVPRKTSETIPLSSTISHRDTGKGAATWCRLLMVASMLIRVFFVKHNGDIREKGKANVYRWVSTQSSNFGTDKSVTVPARASRIRAKRDIIGR